MVIVSASVPFIVAAAASVAGGLIQLFLAKHLENDFKLLLKGNGELKLPGDYSPSSVSRRVARDTDAAQSVVTTAALVPALIAFIPAGSALFLVAIAMAVFVPILSFVAVLLIPPHRYARWTLLNFFSPVLSGALVVNLAMSFFAPYLQG